MHLYFSRVAIPALLASLLTTGVALAQNSADIQLCNAGKALNCEMLGESYRQGANKDPVKAVTYLEKACGLNSSRACNNLGVLWSEGKEGVPKVDHQKAGAYYKKSCDLGNGLGCFNAGNLYRVGEAVPVDFSRAFTYFKKSCDLDQAKGCTELAILYYAGEGVAKNVAMAKTLLEKGCKLGSDVSCKNLVTLTKQQ